MNRKVLIRTELVADHQAIRNLLYTAFENHPEHAPDSPPTEHKIVDALRDAGELTLSLVAEAGGHVVGYAAFSPVQIEEKFCGWYGLGPLAVLPKWQRKGIGSDLIKSGMNKLRARGATGIVVLGDPGYYRRFGFKPQAGLRLDGVPPDHFMCRSFRASVPMGRVTYNAAFSAA